MSKIVTAINAMIRNSEKISKVLLGRDNEIFFEFDKKHKWSIVKRDDDTLLWFYPGTVRLEDLANYANQDWEDFPMITYRASEIGGREAKESFDELHLLVREKAYGIDKVLKDIIEGADDIPF